MKIAIEVVNGKSTTRDEKGRVIVGPFQFGATNFVAKESTEPGSGDGRFVYEGEWVVPPRIENQPS